MERTVQKVLQDAGDHAGAFLWRRLCRDLGGSLRVAVVGRSAKSLARLTDGLQTDATLERVPVTGDAEASIGVQDRVLGTHALLFVTPYPTALGSEERALLATLQKVGAPALRAVVLEGAELLARLSDDPETERADVRARVRSLLPDGWDLLDAADVPQWLTRPDHEVTQLGRDRRVDVARVLLRDAWKRATGEHTTARERLHAAEDQLAEEHAVIDAAHQRGRRIAGHVLAAVRAHTEQLLVDLRDFLVRLEADVPAQAEPVEDLERLRRALPHWLHHVVDGWMHDRLSQWRADVLTDLAEVHIAEDEAPRPELLAPALQPAPVRGERDWNSRLAATAAVGGGAALLLFGQWIPGLLAVTGGIAWSALSRSARSAMSRRRLVETAQAALRQMGQEADTVLRDQLAQIEEELVLLADHRAAEVADARFDQRQALADQAARQSQEVERTADARDALIATIRTLDPGLADELAS